MTNPARPLAADDLAVLDARAAELARPVDDDRPTQTVDVIPFGLGGQNFVAPVAGVREVQRLQVMSRVPQAPPALLGVTRVRSTILPVFDVVSLLGLGVRASGAETKWVLVVDAADHAPLALAAEKVDGVKPLPMTQMLSSEADQHQGALGITPDGAIVLDTEALLDTPPVFGDAAAAAAGASMATPSPHDGDEGGNDE